MTPELQALGYAALLQMAQMALYSVVANRAVGTGYALSPRDTPRSLTGVAGRAQRAMNNHFEGLLLFAIAVLVVYLSDAGSGLTAALAWTYLGARLLYVPAYLLGLSPWRSLIWALGWLATLGLLVVALI